MFLKWLSSVRASAGDAGVAAARALALRSVLPLRASQLLAVLGVSERLQLLQLRAEAAPGGAGALPGHWLLLRDAQSRQSQWLQLVWPAEAAPARGRISVLSPLGLALLGKEPATAIRLQVLGVRFEFELLELLAVRRKKRAGKYV